MQEDLDKRLKDKEKKQKEVVRQQSGKETNVITSNFVETDFEEEDWSQGGMKFYFIKDTHEVNEMVVDCGAPKTLIGERYLKEYLKQNDLEESMLKKTSCKLKFRFGPSQLYISTERVEVPITMRIKDGYTTQFVEAYVVQAEIPFLMGMDILKKWGAVIEIAERKIDFETIGIVVKADKEGGSHLNIALEKVKFDKEPSENEEVKTVLFVELEGTMFNEGTMKKDYEDDNFKIGGDDDKENVGDDNRQVETFIFPDDREDVGGNDQVKTAVLLDELENDEYGRY